MWKQHITDELVIVSVCLGGEKIVYESKRYYLCCILRQHLGASLFFNAYALNVAFSVKGECFAPACCIIEVRSDIMAIKGAQRERSSNDRYKWNFGKNLMRKVTCWVPLMHLFLFSIQYCWRKTYIVCIQSRSWNICSIPKRFIQCTFLYWRSCSKIALTS